MLVLKFIACLVCCRDDKALCMTSFIQQGPYTLHIYKTAKIFPKRIVVAKIVPHIYKTIEKKRCSCDKQLYCVWKIKCIFCSFMCGVREPTVYSNNGIMDKSNISHVILSANGKDNTSRPILDRLLVYFIETWRNFISSKEWLSVMCNAMFSGIGTGKWLPKTWRITWKYLILQCAFCGVRFTIYINFLQVSHFLQKIEQPIYYYSAAWQCLCL